MSERERISSFGLIIIGSEVLDGRRVDAHFHAARRLADERNLRLGYSLLLPDDPGVLDGQLRWAMARPEPFFCCGGIGSTPDDHTRGCAARAAGVPLAMHPEGVAILRARFGAAVDLARLRMVEFPAGAVLIPNPVNRVPGFRIRNGHFVPGFPQMAAPMMAWVLDAWYERGGPIARRALVLPGCKEADLVLLMEAFVVQHPAVSFSSLPRFVEGGTEVVLGLSGAPETVDAAWRDLQRRLRAHGAPWRECDP